MSNSDDLLRRANIVLGTIDLRVLQPGQAVVVKRLNAEIDEHFKPAEVPDVRVQQTKKKVTKKAKKKVAKKR